ncbi:Golgi to ER traffic protein 4 homolog [Leptidea sinapis]|uniref:Golgi to ER traffic protein 4 homolog n=1 Tax=Leptidea sinapis TaxID=189913 RepID=UPI002136C513|nr:Golgi to ER traffic protein 4 homolog [Leptidea sinapis]XP_050671349.1 Golgi to ER traffic protein 4 homolog [Leptidea sinapis]
MASTGEKGVSRVLIKLKLSLENGQYYEAHQIYRTLYFRYLSKKKYDELLDLLYRGATLLIENNQHGSGVDLAILFIDVLVKSETKPNPEWIDKIVTLFKSINSSVPEKDIFLTNAVKWSMDEKKMGHPLLHKKIAEVFWKEKEYLLAHKHFLRSNDGVTFAKMLIDQHTSEALEVDVEILIAKAVLKILVLKNKQMANDALKEYTRTHPMISKEKGPPFSYQLLNFLFLLLKAIDENDANLFKNVRKTYENKIQCDPIYSEYLDKIAKVWFGIEREGTKTQNSMLDGILKSLMTGDLDDSGKEGDKLSQAIVPDLD